MPAQTSLASHSPALLFHACHAATGPALQCNALLCLAGLTRPCLAVPGLASHCRATPAQPCLATTRPALPCLPLAPEGDRIMVQISAHWAYSSPCSSMMCFAT